MVERLAKGASTGFVRMIFQAPLSRWSNLQMKQIARPLLMGSNQFQHSYACARRRCSVNYSETPHATQGSNFEVENLEYDEILGA